MPRVGGSEGEYLAQRDGNLRRCPNGMILPGAFGPILLGANQINVTINKTELV